MEDLQSALQGILSDPEQMARVSALAESLGLKPPDGDARRGGQSVPPAAGGAAGGGKRETDEEPPPAADACARKASAATPLGLEGVDLSALTARLASLNGTEDRILNALRPSLSPEGRSRVDRALRAAKLSRLAGQFMAGGVRRV